ncbi:MAG TPA: hypothetical protein VIW67_12200 [Terriglobales bacterium]|jgi:hypothetical protein
MSSSNIYFEQVPLEIITQEIAVGRISDKMTTEDDPNVGPETMPAYEEGLEYPEWQKPLQEALLEINGSCLEERVRLAEVAIANRLQSIALEPENRREQQAIADALSSLRILKRDILRRAG